MLRPCFLNEYVLRLPQKCRYQVWRERSRNVGKEALLLEGPELLGGTDIYYRGTFLIKSRRNELCIHRKTFLLLMQRGFVRTICSFFKELSGWLLWLKLLFISNWNFSGFNLQSWFFSYAFLPKIREPHIFSLYFLSVKVLTHIKQITLSNPPLFFLIEDWVIWACIFVIQSGIV